MDEQMQRQVDELKAGQDKILTKLDEFISDHHEADLERERRLTRVETQTSLLVKLVIGLTIASAAAVLMHMVNILSSL